MFKLNNEELKFLFKPIGFLVAAIFLSIVIFLVGISQIKSIISKMNASKENRRLLNEKISVLQSIPASISGDTTFLDVVLPSKSAAIYGLSQVKVQAYKNNVLLTNVRTGSAVPEGNGISKVSISFEVEGDEASIFNFLDSFSKILPLMALEKTKITQSGTNVRADSTLNVYSAELPKTIPSVSSTANSLTKEEIDLLKKVASYSLPIFVQPKAQEIKTKEDPFN